MKIENYSLYLESLFQNDRILLAQSTTTYRVFYTRALELSKRFTAKKSDTISLCVENTEEDLSKILACWIANKIVVLHPKAISKKEMLKNESKIKDLKIFCEDQIACYIFTSGSTDTPSPIPLSFKNLFTAAKNYTLHFDVKQTDYLPITLPIYHVGGLMIFLRAIFNNAVSSIHEPGKLKTSEFKIPPDFLSVVPLQMDRIIENNKELNFFKETVFILGGAKTPKSTLEKIKAYRLKVSSTYGMTETSAMVFATNVTSDVNILKSIGRPLSGVVPSFSSNETLNITGPSVSPLFENSTIKTNDIVTEEEGLFFIEGRADEVFISGGENINPNEIEATLSSANITGPLVIPVDDNSLGQMSTLFYSGEESIDEVREIIKLNLIPFKRPRYIFKLPDFSFTGIKIKKKILKDVAPFYVNLNKAAEIFPLNYQGDPRRPWLILLHGFMGDKDDWKVLGELLKNDFFTIAIDLPGHGENDKVTGCSLESFQMDFEKFSSQLKHNFSLLGYSQGGRLALGLVARGLKIESLIIESAALGIVDEQERELRYQSDLKMFQSISSQKDLLKFLTYWYENPLFGALKDHPDFSTMLEKKSNHPWKLWQESQKAFSVGIQPNYRGLLSKMSNLKALTICGENDHKYLAVSKELETKFKFEFSMLKNCSHNTHFENPKEFSKIVTNFLNSKK